MNIRQIHRNFVNIKRFQEIAYILAKYGFTDLLDFLRVDQALGLAKKVGLVSKEFALFSRAQRLKLAAEELGPTFIKLGQILSTRDDLLDSDYIEELKKLQDQVREVPSEEVKLTLKQFYDVDDLNEIFDRFDYSPIATASISQVHEAYLLTGERVIVKIQRPKIREIIEQDLGVLSYIAELIQEQFGDPEDPASWSQVIGDFIHQIIQELDFGREARLMLRFDAMFKDDSGIKIPKVFMQYSGNKVIVQELIDGCRLDDLDGLQKMDANFGLIAERLIQSFFQQVFSEGVFHGDPHPGNLRVLPDNVLVFLDFGLVGQLDNDNMTQLTRIFWGAGREDFELVSRSFNKLCRGTILGVNETMTMEFRDLILAYRSLTMQEIKVDILLPAADQILKRGQLRLPSQLSILFKSLICLERVVNKLNANLNLMDFLLPRIQQMIRKRLEVKSMSNHVTDSSLLMYDYMAEIPKDLFQIVKNIQKNQHEASVRHSKLEFWLQNFEKILNRAILGLLVSSTLIGSSLLLSFIKPGENLLYVLAYAGYICAALFALVIIYSIVTVGQPGKE
ncbi:MAG: AarF/UbiB family protein [bacterium]|nr:AarF/UbiB family protein [bacterium]